MLFIFSGTGLVPFPWGSLFYLRLKFSNYLTWNFLSKNGKKKFQKYEIWNLNMILIVIRIYYCVEFHSIKIVISIEKLSNIWNVNFKIFNKKRNLFNDHLLVILDVLRGKEFMFIFNYFPNFSWNLLCNNKVFQISQKI